MSEVVPLPSFGEVFFDARGQERVLRVTWHEGTLVLSLWRGEMCTASFRMPLEDVGRLLDTLDDGYAEAGGDELVESGQHAIQHTGAGDLPDDAEHGDYPQTGHYARPGEDAYPAAAQIDYQTGQYGRPDDDDYYGEPEPEERPMQPRGQSDVLVARGTPAADKLVAGYGAAPEAVPRENLIVNDALEYGQPDPGYPRETGYQLPGEPYPMPAPSAGPATDPYGFAASEVESHNPGYSVPPQPAATPYGTQPDVFTSPRHDLPDLDSVAGYGRQVPHPDPYGTPGYGDDQGRAYGSVDPSNPLGIGPPDDYYQGDPGRPYVNDSLYATGERLRPEQGHDERDNRGDW